jgi:hypothetical protein
MMDLVRSMVCSAVHSPAPLNTSGVLRASGTDGRKVDEPVCLYPDVLQGAAAH